MSDGRATMPTASVSDMNRDEDVETMRSFAGRFTTTLTAQAAARILARLERAEKTVAALEQLRPVWAQGYTSESIAAQTSAAALSRLWKMLDARCQTDAVMKLRAALAGEKAPVEAPAGERVCACPPGTCAIASSWRGVATADGSRCKAGNDSP
jgi:hypothetical protein